MRLPWKQVRSLCEEKQSRGRGIRPRCETWAWGEGSPKAELGGQEAIAPPCLLPHRRYQAQKPRKGELGLFLFCSQPLPVSKLRAAARLTPPCPHPRRPFWREPAPPPRSPTSILAAVVPHPGLCTAPWDTQMDPPTHTPLPRASPLHARRGRLDPLSQRRADSPSAPTAAFRRAHGCPTGGPGQRCPVPCPGTQAYLLLRDE